MKIELAPEHQRWLAEEVAAGRYRSMDEAVACALEAMRHATESDLEWARPDIEDGDVSLARGEGISGEQFFVQLDRKLAALRRK